MRRIAWLLPLLFLPALASAWTESANCRNDFEDIDSGRNTATSTSFELQSSLGALCQQSTTSTLAEIHQGYFFTITRDFLPPTPVTVVNHSQQTNGTLNLSWNASSDQESEVWGYRVYRIYYFGPKIYEQRLVDAPANTVTVFQDAGGLIKGINYYYEIRSMDLALNEQSCGNKREPVTAKIMPHSITDLNATPKPGGDIDLTWSLIPGTDHYNIYRSVTYGAQGEKITETTQPTFRDVKTDLEPGIRYYYLIQPVVGGVEETQGNNQAWGISDQGGPNAPIIRSDTHPVQGQPYPNPSPRFQWVASADPGVNTRAHGYYTRIDHEPSTGTAFSTSAWQWLTATHKEYQGLDNGNWYFHCRGVDEANNLGDEGIYAFVVLATGAIQGDAKEEGSNKVLENIVVEAWLNNVKQAETRSQSDGTYQLNNLPFATYMLRFNRFGYLPTEIKDAALSINTTPLTIHAVCHSQPVISQQQTAAYPNPANGQDVRMIYYCEEPSEVTIEIYNVAGKMVAKIRDTKPAGYQYSVWPLVSVARGVYMFRPMIVGNSGKKTVLPIKKFAVIK